MANKYFLFQTFYFWTRIRSKICHNFWRNLLLQSAFYMCHKYWVLFEGRVFKKSEQTLQTLKRWDTPKNHFLAGIDMNNWLRQLFTPRDRQSRDSIIGFFLFLFITHFFVCIHTSAVRRCYFHRFFFKTS